VAGAALGCYVVIRRYGQINEVPTGSGDPKMISNRAGDAKEGAK
jgi:hypothetical protein